MPLNPELTAHIPDEQKFKIYASALTTILLDDHNYIPTTDNRLLRRIVRDYKYRGCSAQETIRRWPSVRAGENKWIFPYQENADVMFNSAMLFELAVIKNQAEEVLEQVPKDARSMPRHIAYENSSNTSPPCPTKVCHQPHFYANSWADRRSNTKIASLLCPKYPKQDKAIQDYTLHVFLQIVHLSQFAKRLLYPKSHI